MRKVLVTGGCGFIGSNLVESLISRGINASDITVIDNLSSSSSCEGNKAEQVHYLTADVQMIDNHTDERFDVIFHLAADARIQPSFHEPLKTLENNIVSTATILEYARKHGGTKVVYAGSSSFYNGTKKSPYAFSKWVGEEACQLYAQIYSLPVVIARFFNVYGARQPIEGEYATVIGIFEREYKLGNDLPVVGNGEMRRDFTHIKDICEGLTLMAKRSVSGYYNLGTGRNYSINEVADKIIRIGAKNVGKRYLQERIGEAANTLADITKAKADLGYRPAYDLMDYLETVIE